MTMFARLRPQSATLLAILAAALCTLPQTGCSKNAPDADGWITLFDGKTLNGWEELAPELIDAPSVSWKVEDGELVGRQVFPSTHDRGTMLRTVQSFKDFELEFDVKPGWDSSSGVGLRTNSFGHSISVPVIYRNGGSVGHIQGLGVGEFNTSTFQIVLNGRAKNGGEEIGAKSISISRSEEIARFDEEIARLSRRISDQEERIKEFEKSIPVEAQPNSDGINSVEMKIRQTLATLQSLDIALGELASFSDTIKQAQSDIQSPEAIMLLLNKQFGQPGASPELGGDESQRPTVGQYVEAIALAHRLLEGRRIKLRHSVEALKEENIRYRKFTAELLALKSSLITSRELQEQAKSNRTQILLKPVNATQVPGVEYACDASAWLQSWKENDWNRIRVLVEGSPAKISTWINGEKVVTWDGSKYLDPHYDSTRVVENLGSEGRISLQVDGRVPWPEGTVCRWRNIRVRELK